MHRRSASEAIHRIRAKVDANSSSEGRHQKLNVGDIIEVANKPGTIKFVGETSFDTGNWVGIELTKPEGKNDGSVQGKRYFQCKPNFGIFVRPSQVKVVVQVALSPSAARTSFGSTAATTTPRRRIGSVRHSVHVDLPKTETASRVAEIRARFNRPGVINRRGTISDSPTTPLSPTTEEGAEEPKEEPAPVDTELEVIKEPEEEAQVSFAPVSLRERSEHMVPVRMLDEVRVRLRVLEQKRAEDITRWNSIEKERQELETFKVNKARFIQKLKELQEDNKKLRELGRELKKTRDSLQVKVDDSDLLVETLTVDRELAEERANHLQYNLDSLKEKMDELNLRMETERDEAAGDALIEAGFDANAAKIIVEKEAQINRLKNALLEARDIAVHNETELRSQLRQAEEELNTHKTLKADYQDVKDKFANAEEVITELKLQLDDFAEAEGTIDMLTSQNIILHDKVEDMAKEIEELEALKEVSDELEETHNENKKQFLAELDHKAAIIRDLTRKVESQEETIADYSETLVQYRQLTASLEEDIKKLQENASSQLNENDTLQSQSQKMLSLNSTLQSLVIKAQAKTIDLELRKLDASQALEHLKCIESYLPESFFKKENDAIRTFLKFKRLFFKADLIGKFLCDQFPIKALANLVSGKVEELTPLPDIMISNYEVRHKLTEMSKYINYFIAFLTTCTVSEFLGMSRLGNELESIEKRFDYYLDEIRHENFVSFSYLKEMDGFTAQFIELTETHLKDKLEVPALLASSTSDKIRTLVSGSEVFNLKLALVYRAIVNPTEVNLFHNITNSDKKDIAAEFLKPLIDVLKTYQSVWTLNKKLIKSDEEALARNQYLSPKLQTKIEKVYAKHNQLVQFASQVSAAIVDFLKERQLNNEDVKLVGLQNTVYRITQGVLQDSEMNTFDVVARFVHEVNDASKDLADFSNVKEVFVDVPKYEFPWITRSHEFKKEIVVNVAMDRKLESLNRDIARLVQDVRDKNEVLSERDLKVELLESRMQKMHAQIEEADEAKQQLATAQEQERLYLEAVEKLQNEIQQLEVENVDLRQTLHAKDSAQNERQTEQVQIPESVKPAATSTLLTLPKANALESQINSLNLQVERLAENLALTKASYLAQDVQFQPSALLTLATKKLHKLLNRIPLPQQPTDSTNDPGINTSPTQLNSLLNKVKVLATSTNILVSSLDSNMAGGSETKLSKKKVQKVTPFIQASVMLTYGSQLELFEHTNNQTRNYQMRGSMVPFNFSKAVV